MNTLRKYLNIVASLLCITIGTVYLIDAVLTSRTMIKLSGGKTLFLFADDHLRNQQEFFSIEELQVQTLAQEIALLSNDKTIKVLVEEPPKNILDKRAVVTNTKLLAAYCSDDGLRVVIKDVDFRKKYLEDSYYRFSNKAEEDYSCLCENLKSQVRELPVETAVVDLVSKALKIKEEETVVCAQALHPLLDATFIKEIYESPDDVVAVVAGYLHTMKVTQVIAKIDPDAWSKRQTIGLDGQGTITPLETQYLSLSPDTKKIDQNTWCNLL